MLDELLRAIGLMLVIEGIIPFLSPGRWRGMVEVLATVDEKSMRMVGLFSMLTGLFVLLLFS
ncbi:MAG: DUF2065 domain-containing protein [Porticoccaceae bacterium]|jgi:uncharacterized protein|nr:DUF2065 domain-containing protein [Porticoccaceae bacterium]MBT5576919.1 DUF2065 domain-containing protein [Porticoccaceae bacterium]MBT7376037.1 DUF2065 domain-containing protein [Porticoccaceae bacterium]